MYVLILVIVILAAAILVSIHVLTFRAIRRRGKSTVWRRVAVAAVIGGAMAGFISGIVVRWRPQPDIEYVGFPIPGMLLLYEDGRWVDYIGPGVLISPVLNALVVATVFILPVSFALFVRRKR